MKSKLINSTTIIKRLNNTQSGDNQQFLIRLIFDLDFFTWVQLKLDDCQWFEDLYVRGDRMISSDHDSRLVFLLNHQQYLDLVHRYLSTIDRPLESSIWL